jgi:hypothetical protein
MQRPESEPVVRPGCGSWQFGTKHEARDLGHVTSVTFFFTFHHVPRALISQSRAFSKRNYCCSSLGAPSLIQPSMPYAAPSSQAKTLYQTVGPGRRAQLEGHSSTAPAAGFSRGEVGTRRHTRLPSQSQTIHLPSSLQPHHPDISMESAAQLNSTRERSDNNRFAPLSSRPSPIHRSRSGASTRYRRIDDSDIEYDSVSASGSDDYMSLDGWSEDDSDFEMATDPGRPLSRESSASNQTGFESHIPPNLFSTPNFNYTDHTTAPFSARGLTIGTTPYTEVVRRGDHQSGRSNGHASREPVWDRNAHSASRAAPMCIVRISNSTEKSTRVLPFLFRSARLSRRTEGRAMWVTQHAV